MTSRTSTDQPPGTGEGEVGLLRHTLATLAYRAGKVLRDAPPGFGDFRDRPDARTPTEVVSHMADLMAWGTRMASGEHRWEAGQCVDFDEAVGQFFDGLAELDEALERRQPNAHPPARIFQGPIADALTHVGQLALLRRAAGGPVRPENYARARITIGNVGPTQADPRAEFDTDASWPEREG